jgi:hypothetical protein
MARHVRHAVLKSSAISPTARDDVIASALTARVFHLEPWSNTGENYAHDVKFAPP